MSKREKLTLSAKSKESAPVAVKQDLIKVNTQSSPVPELPSVSVEQTQVILTRSKVQQVPLIQIPGIYLLKCKKLVVITDIDKSQNVGYDATGANIWDLKTGMLIFASTSREWDVDKFIITIPEIK